MWNILHFQVIFLHTEIASTLWFVFSSVFVSFLWHGREICCLFIFPLSKTTEIYLHPTILIYVHPTILINQHIWNMLHPQVQFSMTVWQGERSVAFLCILGRRRDLSQLKSSCSFPIYTFYYIFNFGWITQYTIYTCTIVQYRLWTHITVYVWYEGKIGKGKL